MEMLCHEATRSEEIWSVSKPDFKVKCILYEREFILMKYSKCVASVWQILEQYIFYCLKLAALSLIKSWYYSSSLRNNFILINIQLWLRFERKWYSRKALFALFTLFKSVMRRREKLCSNSKKKKYPGISCAQIWTKVNLRHDWT